MPKFDPTGEVAGKSDRTPGRWLVKIPRQAQIGKDAAPRPGIETLDNRTSQPRKSSTGHEMWSATAEVIDDHPEAPTGAFILGLNLLWGGKGRDATYRLLKCVGQPVDDWKKITDPTKLPEITPEFFYERPFVLDTEVDERGYLQARGFSPYDLPTSRRGPNYGAVAGPKPAGGNGGGGGAPSTAGGPRPPAATGKLPF